MATGPICPCCCNCPSTSELHNTGDGLSVGDVDPNWTADIGACTVVDTAGYRVDGRWNTDDPPSQWISAFGSTADSDATAPQENVYTTHFTVGSSADAALCLRVMSDNCVTNVSLNGHTVVDPDTCDDHSFGHWDYYSFNDPATFVTGSNTLTFTVFDEGDVAGLRVEFCPMSSPPPMMAPAAPGAAPAPSRADRVRMSLGPRRKCCGKK